MHNRICLHSVVVLACHHYVHRNSKALTRVKHTTPGTLIFEAGGDSKGSRSGSTYLTTQHIARIKRRRDHFTIMICNGYSRSIHVLRICRLAQGGFID